MTTLHDLRATLDQHAAEVEDHERYARPTAVRERIRDVRRRRVTSVAVAAVVVLLAALSVAGLTLLRDDRIEPADVLDVDVPQQVEISGTPYTLEGVRRVTAGQSVSVTDADQLVAGQGPAVSLVATGLGEGRATLSADGQPLTALVGDDTLSAPVVSVLGGIGTAVVDLDGAPADAGIGIAVYRPVIGDPTAAASLFPADTGSRVRVDAAVAHPDDDGVQLVVTGPSEDLTFDTYCQTDQRDISVTLEIDGEFQSGGGCDENRSTSRGADVSLSSGPHVVRAVFNRGDSPGTPVRTGPGTTLGIAAYRWTPRRDVLGTPVSETVVSGGRRWTLDQVIPEDSRGEVRASIQTGDRDALLGYVTRGGTDIWWRGGLVERDHDSFPAPDTSFTQVELAGLLLAGDTYEVTATPDSGEGDRAVLVYRPE